jgi:hypothetical protein
MAVRVAVWAHSPILLTEDFMPSETPKKSNLLEINRGKKPKPTKETDPHNLDELDPEVRRDVETGEENAT